MESIHLRYFDLGATFRLCVVQLFNPNYTVPSTVGVEALLPRREEPRPTDRQIDLPLR